jgi:hypothetical protein
VSASTIQCERRSMDFIRVSTRHSLLQHRTWEHVSGTCAQLGQSGHRERSQGRFPFAGAMSITCLHAQIWNILGTRRRAEYTISQSTRSKLCVKRIFASWNLVLAICLWAQKWTLSPLSDLTLFFPRKTHTGSRGKHFVCLE